MTAVAPTDADLKRIINAHFAGLEEGEKRAPYRPIADGLIDEGRRFLGTVHDYPVSFACAIAEKETWGRVLFGCDDGSLFCQHEVNRERVERLIRFVRRGDGPSNGVGIGQPTFFPLIEEMEEMGGAEVPRHQMVVCFRLMQGLVRSYGYYNGVGAFNAGWSGRHAVRWTYTADVERLHEQWIRRLT